MEVAYLSTLARGSSTACILCLENERLHASNLGDSGVGVGDVGATCSTARQPDTRGALLALAAIVCSCGRGLGGMEQPW